jgi:hypothetical protein
MSSRYGTAHKRIRERAKERVDAGVAACARCGRLIRPGEPWDMGHDDFDRNQYSGPEHRRCNRSTYGRASRPLRFSRDW